MADNILVVKSLPERDRFLMEKIQITFQELVLRDYREIWEKFSKGNLSKCEVKRLKHIRKREKNKIFEKEKDLRYKNAMNRLSLQKDELVSAREKLREEIRLIQNQISNLEQTSCP